MKQFCILVSIFLLVIGCRTRKVQKHQESKVETKKVQVSQESVAKIEVEKLHEIAENLKSSNFNHQLNLTPKIDNTGVVQPVEYKELRNGKPYREIYIKGGSLNENKQVKSKANEKRYNSIVKQNKQLKSQLVKALDIILQWEQRQRQIEAKGFQFGVYLIAGFGLLLLIALGYFEYRIKKYLNGL